MQRLIGTTRCHLNICPPRAPLEVCLYRVATGAAGIPCTTQVPSAVTCVLVVTCWALCSLAASPVKNWVNKLLNLIVDTRQFSSVCLWQCFTSSGSRVGSRRRGVSWWDTRCGHRGSSGLCGGHSGGFVCRQNAVGAFVKRTSTLIYGCTLTLLLLVFCLECARGCVGSANLVRKWIPNTSL